jgi:hypothetical protein
MISILDTIKIIENDKNIIKIFRILLKIILLSVEFLDY